MKESEDISARAEEAYERCHNSVNKEEFINNFINSYKSRKMLDNYDLTQKIINLKSKFGRGLGGVHLGRDIQILDILMDLSRMLNEGYKACLAAQSQSVEESKLPDDIRNKLGPFKNLIAQMDKITKDLEFGSNEIEKLILAEMMQCKVSLEYLTNLKVSEERKFTKEEMEKAMLFTFDNISSSYPRIEIERRVERYIESLPSGTIKKNEI